MNISHLSMSITVSLFLFVSTPYLVGRSVILQSKKKKLVFRIFIMQIA